MKTYYPYDVTHPQPISGEVHQIIGGQIRLTHIPLEGSLTIQGFVEAQSASHLQSNEFFCNYSRQTLYRESNRIVYFSSARSGQSVTCSYQACGSPVTADDMNEIKAHMEKSDTAFSDLDIELKNWRNLLANALSVLSKAITDHERNYNCHVDIRTEIKELKEKIAELSK